MAELKLPNLVLRGVRVANDVATVQERIGCGLAVDTSTIPLSFTRHLPPANPDCAAGPDKRNEPANMYGVARSAQRAGRSGSRAGALSSRTLARTARPAVLSGQPASTAGHTDTNANTGQLTVTARAFVGLSLSPHSQSFRPSPDQRPARVAFWRREVGGKGRRAELAFMGLALGMRSASA